jgi:hypothetical protein
MPAGTTLPSGPSLSTCPLHRKRSGRRQRRRRERSYPRSDQLCRGRCPAVASSLRNSLRRSHNQRSAFRGATSTTGHARGHRVVIPLRICFETDPLAGRGLLSHWRKAPVMVICRPVGTLKVIRGVLAAATYIRRRLTDSQSEVIQHTPPTTLSYERTS